MIKFELKKEKDTPYYTLSLMKEVHKRSGEIVEEKGDSFYTLGLTQVKVALSHLNAQTKFEDKDISLKEYLIEYYKSYNEICELLKRTL
jgi:hypothetical protein